MDTIQFMRYILDFDPGRCQVRINIKDDMINSILLGLLVVEMGGKEAFIFAQAGLGKVFVDDLKGIKIATMRPKPEEDTFYRQSRLSHH